MDRQKNITHEENRGSIVGARYVVQCKSSRSGGGDGRPGSNLSEMGGQRQIKVQNLTTFLIFCETEFHSEPETCVNAIYQVPAPIL